MNKFLKTTLKYLKYITTAFKGETDVYRPIYRVARIDQDDNGEYLATIQIIGKSTVFVAKPEEVLKDNKLVNLFTPTDVRNLTYLGYLGINSPKYKILAKRLSEKEGQTFFAIHKKGEKNHKVYTANDISTNEEILNSLNQQDAHMVGFTTATEQRSVEISQIKKLQQSKKIKSNKDKNNDE